MTEAWPRLAVFYEAAMALAGTPILLRRLLDRYPGEAGVLRASLTGQGMNGGDLGRCRDYGFLPRFDPRSRVGRRCAVVGNPMLIPVMTRRALQAVRDGGGRSAPGKPVRSR